MYDKGHLTPADGQVTVEVLPLTEDGDDQQAVQVDALHQQPVVVSHDTVLHHHHGSTAPRYGLTEDTGRDEERTRKSRLHTYTVSVFTGCSSTGLNPNVANERCGLRLLISSHFDIWTMLFPHN